MRIQVQRKYSLIVQILAVMAIIAACFGFIKWPSTFPITTYDSFSFHSSSSLNKLSDNDSKCTVIWHYHIGKTGGKNLRYILKQKYKFAFDFWSLSDSYNKTEAFYFHLIPFINKNLYDDNTLYIHHHHRSYSFAEFVSLGLYDFIANLVGNQKKCDILFITLFREPIQRLLSHLAYDGYDINNNVNGTIDKLITYSYDNVQIGYLNYNIYWKEINQFNLLNDSVYINTLKLVNDHFNIIGFCDKYNEFLAKLYDATNIEYDGKNEFDKPLYREKRNKLPSNRKIRRIDVDLLKLIISSQYWDFKLYYHFRK